MNADIEALLRYLDSQAVSDTRGLAQAAFWVLRSTGATARARAERRAKALEGRRARWQRWAAAVRALA